MKTVENSNVLTTKNLYWIGGFILLYLVSVLIHLNYYPLNGDEPRRAVVSIEMLHSGNYIMPTTMGWEYYNKPPVYNWIMSVCMRLTGSTSEIPVRLPSLIFILVWGICNFFIVRKILPPVIAALSSLFLVTSFDIFFWGLSNGGEIDVFYSFIVYLQVIFMYRFNQQGKWLALFVVSYLFCAIGFLTKGFPSLLFQGFTLAALCLFNRSARVVFRWQHLAGLLTMGAVVGGYLYAYSFYSSPGTLLADLLKEAFNKSAFGEYPERLINKIIEYPFSFLKILLPWSLLLLLLFKKHRFRIWNNDLLRFSILFIAFNIPVYWFTGHPRMRYVYMFLPFAMFILAYIFYYFREEFPGLVKKIMKYAFLFFVLCLAGIIFMPLKYEVNYALLGISVAMLMLFILLKRRVAVASIWYFGIGIVVLRMVYSLVLIPVRYDHAELKYDKEMEAIAIANGYRPVAIYKPSDTLALEIDIRISKFDFGTIPAIPYIAYQMPYYYYLKSGQIVTFDTVLQKGRNYIGFRSNIERLRPQILYSFPDKNQNNEEVVLFRLDDQYEEDLEEKR